MPVLGDHYGRVLEAGELAVERQGGSFVVRYYEHEAPLSPAIPGRAASAPRRSRAGSAAAGETWPPTLASCRTRSSPIRRPSPSGTLGKEAAAGAPGAGCAQTHPEVAAAIDAEIAAVNGDPDALDELLGRQNYRLAYWGTAAEELSYRRFFNIESLVGLRVEDADVFADTHRLVLELVARRRRSTDCGSTTSTACADPEGYLDRLREPPAAPTSWWRRSWRRTRSCPGSWPVAGTSGYDFLNRVNQLFVDPAGEERCCGGLRRLHRRDGPTTPRSRTTAKLQIMREELAAEVERLTGLLAERVRAAPPPARPHPPGAARGAARAHRRLRRLPHLRPPGRPRHRRGPRARRPPPSTGALARRPDIDRGAGRLPRRRCSSGDHPATPEAEFAVRFAQVSAPVMAKGVEDTAFYRYLPLVSPQRGRRRPWPVRPAGRRLPRRQ